MTQGKLPPSSAKVLTKKAVVRHYFFLGQDVVHDLTISRGLLIPEQPDLG
jgi:hypothetical protein